MSGPDGPAPVPRTTREDWLRVAVDMLVSEGIGEVKALALGQRLGVSRSSFYWFFYDRQDLLNGLLDYWGATSTAAFLRHAGMEVPTVAAAVGNVFRLFVDVRLFDPRLDFAVRRRARRDGSVRRALDAVDAGRLGALAAMFEHHGYDAQEAMIRAQVFYWMQVDCYVLDLREPLEGRLARAPGYLLTLTGREPAPGEVEAFQDQARGRRA